MSDDEELDFIEEYLSWTKGSEENHEYIEILNFGYEGKLPYPSISLTPDSDLTAIRKSCTKSIAIVGEKYFGRHNEITETIDRIQKYTRALSVGRIVQTKETQVEKFNSQMPAATVSSLVEILKFKTLIPLIKPNDIFDRPETISIIWVNIDNLIQAQIPQRRSRRSFVFKMKCAGNSTTIHNVMISREVKVPSYKDICG